MTTKLFQRTQLLFILASIGAFTFSARVITADEGTSFRSVDGKFQASFPAKPQHSTTPLGDGKAPTDVQHQFAAGGPDGAYLISYQDNPNLNGVGAKGLEQALLVGRDTLVQTFGGEVTQDRPIQLKKKYPGRDMVITIPSAGGIGRCRLYLVDARLYQIMVLGKPEFANSDVATKFIESFEILPTPNK